MDFAYNIYVILSTLLLHNCMGQGSVGFQIKILPDQTALQFKVGESRLLTCEATTTQNDKKPNLHWEFNGTPITSTNLVDRRYVEPDSVPGSLTLRVLDVQDGDEGIYKCVATLGSQTDSRSIQVQVWQDLVINSKHEQFGLFGADGMLDCQATSRPAPSITWKYANGTRIQNSDKYVIQQNALKISNLIDSDTMVYLCNVDVLDAGKNEQFFIKFKVVHVPKMDMIPIISPNNPKVGEPEVKITCHATGDPKPVYSFRRDGNIFGNNMVDANNGILTLTNLKQADEGDYTCTAANIGGSDESSNYLDVKVPPQIDDIADVTDAVEGGQVKFTCRARGDPAPTVKWQKNDLSYYNDGIRDGGPEITNEPSTDREDAEIKTVGKTMSFNPIRPQDVGKYTCVAVNVVGNATKTIKFLVRYKPTFDTDYKDTVFYSWKGDTANMTCLASANSLAVINWYHLIDNRTVRIETVAPYIMATPQQWPEYFLTSSSVMVYVDDDYSAVFKDYTCEAENELGRTSYKVTLRRALPPGVPSVSIPTVLSTKAILEVRPPSETGGKPVTGYRCIYYPESDSSQRLEKYVDKTQDPTMLELTDLKANTLYWFKTAAGNAVGYGIENTISIKTQEVSAPRMLDIISPIVGPEPNWYTLEWSNPDDGGSPIIRYVISYRRVTATGNEPGEWRITGDIDKTYTELVITDPNARKATIKGMDPNTFYEIRFQATNAIGTSQITNRVIKTSQGGRPIYDTNTISRGMASGLVIGIVVGVIIFILFIALIIFVVLKKRPELVDRLKKRGREDERERKEDRKELTKEEMLAKKDDTVKVENETSKERTEEPTEKHSQLEANNQPDKPTPVTTKTAAENKIKFLASPAPNADTAVVPQTPNKCESDAA